MDLEQLSLLAGIVTMAGGAFYFAGALRANLRELKDIVRDHEERLRAGGL